MTYNKQIESRWIPCSERLPAEGTKVLICDRKNNIYIVTACNGYILHGFWDLENIVCYPDTVAWMPLPEPPYQMEGDEEDE
jgi:hypothetical protein